MEPIFTLPHSEFEAISIFNDIFKKKGFATLVPTSRQQGGIDFVVMKTGTRKILRVQVKSSRHYANKKSAAIDFWFKNFSYRPGIADIYLLLGVYPDYAPTQPVSQAAWRTLLLALHDSEMETLLAAAKTKGGTTDRFFGFGFNPPAQGAPLVVIANRGAATGTDYSKFLIQRRREEIARLLDM